MMYSMTAFAQKRIECQTGMFYWEIRSLNHRFLELSFRLPDGLNEIEPSLRQMVKGVLKRGKIECHLKYEPISNNVEQFALNHSLVKKIAYTSGLLSNYFTDLAPISAVDILKWPGIMQNSVLGQTESIEIIKTGFLESIKALKDCRLREGQLLEQTIKQCLFSMSKCLEEIENRVPLVLKIQREQIIDKLQVLAIDFDVNRLEQELLYWAQRLDITEELDRLKSHLIEISSILMQDDTVGRRLDFLMQELNREVNTIGSKSCDLSITKMTVELKVLIEQMREQIQNIE